MDMTYNIMTLNSWHKGISIHHLSGKPALVPMETMLIILYSTFAVTTYFNSIKIKNAKLT